MRATTSCATMNHVSALVILVLLLFGPLAISWIEHNIELYCLGLGILVTILWPGVHPAHGRRRQPCAISLAVIVAALLFGWSGPWLDRSFSALRAQVSRPVLSASAIFVIA